MSESREVLKAYKFLFWYIAFMSTLSVVLTVLWHLWSES